MKEQSKFAYGLILSAMNDRLESLGISQYELAKRTGLDRATVKRVLEGSREPTVPTWIALLIGLELNVVLIDKESYDLPDSGRVYFN